MAKIMEHDARIVAVFPDERRVEAEMMVSSACGNCKAKAVCGGEQESRVVSAYTAHPEVYKVGDEVTISIEQIMGYKAITLSYIVPLVVMIAALAITHSRWGDLVAGLSALGACALYFVILSFFRKRLEKVIVFSVKGKYF
jgi:sigma-E factor negative regulatory protein RseC